MNKSNVHQLAVILWGLAILFMLADVHEYTIVKGIILTVQIALLIMGVVQLRSWGWTFMAMLGWLTGISLGMALLSTHALSIMLFTVVVIVVYHLAAIKHDYENKA